MAQWVNPLWNNVFAPLLHENSIALHLAQPDLTAGKLASIHSLQMLLRNSRRIHDANLFLLHVRN